MEPGSLVRSRTAIFLTVFGQTLQHEGSTDPRTVQTDLDQTDLLAVGVQVVDDFLWDIAEGTHADDHAVGVAAP